ncbi:MAG: helix-turn-helix domain-containing protein [Solirubrobacteraceae bacterium]
MNPIVAAVLEALRDDPEAVEVLRDVLAVPEPQDAGPRWRTVRTLAAELKVSEKVVRNAITRGDLQAVKRAGRWFISTEASDRWLTDRAEPAARGPLRAAFRTYDRRRAA